MKQTLVAALLLAASAVTASAQATRDAATLYRGTPPALTLPRQTVPQDDGAAPSAEPLPTPSDARRAFLGGKTLRFVQSPPAEAGGAAGAAETLEATAQGVETRAGRGFRWGAAFRQSMAFLSIQHAYALTQPKTRKDLHGPFFKDYFRSVRALHGWADGGRFFTNYIAHPLEGSLYGFIQVQNDPAGARLRVGDAGYWRSRMKALAWSAAWSTQFEIGPLSQASIGNVGLHGKQTYVDIVMTPTAGIAFLVAEDTLDRFVIQRLEQRGKYARIFARMLLNPTRTTANLLRLKKPWYRDRGLR
ncbi:MAG TPA: hypothetical protein VF297_05900 [Pyrinomonadaceae bacterium]